ncbi:MAG: hypothetical protein LBP71_06205 [Spirochaetaceae bacterium]|jgi:hypothetical protein|nr:hypothetical protein [Spirochaetaceae bacterium]
MAQKKHFIPGPGPAYDTFFNNVRQYTNAKCSPPDAPEWSFIPSAELAALNDAYADWHAAYTPTIKPHTPAETAARNAAWKRSKKVLARFIQVWFRGFPDRVTEEDLRNMGIPPIDDIRSPVPPPQVQVEADLVFPGIHMVELRKIRPVSGPDQPDPRSDYGVRIYYGFTGSASEQYPFRLADPLKTGKVLPYSIFTRKQKERFDFDGESGNTVYFCLRYENSKGEVGPFGPVLSAVIP